MPTLSCQGLHLAVLCVVLITGIGFAGSALAQQHQPGSRTQGKNPPPSGLEAAAKADEHDFKLPYIDGKGDLSFSELADSGQPFVVFFWRTDCPLCHMQMPYVQQLQRLIEEQAVDLRLVSICLDDTARDALPLIEEKELTFTVLHDGHGRRTENNYHAKDIGLPLTYVFKTDGKYVDYLSGFRAGYAKAVLQMLDIPLPAELKKR
jgi:thiol-disulfide isomerase/thioredoxin